MTEDIQTDNAPRSDTKVATVKVTAPDTEISREVDEQVMLAVINLIVAGTGGVPQFSTPGSGGAAAATPGEKEDPGLPIRKTNLTLKEFIRESDAKSFPNKICAAGYYIVHHEGKESFTKDEVRLELERAREPKPSNYSRDWARAVSNSLIAENRDSGQFYITVTGDKAVESKFTEVPRNTSRRAPKKASTKAGDSE